MSYDRYIYGKYLVYDKCHVGGIYQANICHMTNGLSDIYTRYIQVYIMHFEIGRSGPQQDCD
jgi:hypothetical protein